MSELQGGFNKKCCHDVKFLDVLEDLVSEYIKVIVMSGGACPDSGGSDECCCQHEGTLCNIGLDFILLINGDEKTYIPFDAIAAVKQD